VNPTVIATIISSAGTLLGTIITVIVALHNQAKKTETQIEVLNTEMKGMKEDIKSHNKYAQMFSENIPAIKQHMIDVDRRLDAIERRSA